MRRRVSAKQPSSRMCLVCGTENVFGLRADFFELEGDELLAIFEPRDEHQSYPGRLHGGVAAAILDETIGRAIMMRHDGDVWGVAVELTTRYKKPVPLGQALRVIGRITRDTSRIFEGTGEILLEDGSVAVEGRGKYLRFPIDQIAEFDLSRDWRVVSAESDPEEIEV